MENPNERDPSTPRPRSDQTRRQFRQNSSQPDSGANIEDDGVDNVRTMLLHDEELVVHRAMKPAGEVIIRKVVETVPIEADLDQFQEDVEIERVPVGRVVDERSAPWKQGDAYVIPVYDEEEVVVKRLILREEIRVRRLLTTSKAHLKDVVRRERIIVDDPRAKRSESLDPPNGSSTLVKRPNRATRRTEADENPADNLLKAIAKKLAPKSDAQ